MLNKLDEKDFILVRKLFVAPTQIRNRFYLILGSKCGTFPHSKITSITSKIGQMAQIRGKNTGQSRSLNERVTFETKPKKQYFAWVSTYPPSGWIPNRTPTASVILHKKYYKTWIWNDIRWLGVLFEIQSKGAIRRNQPTRNLPFQLNFKCNSGSVKD